MHELLALQRALHIAKFGASSFGAELIASPFVGSLYSRVLEELERKFEASGNAYKAKSFRAWRELDGHVDVIDTIEAYIIAMKDDVLAMSSVDKAELLEAIVSPFVPTESLRVRLEAQLGSKRE